MLFEVFEEERFFGDPRIQERFNQLILHLFLTAVYIQEFDPDIFNVILFGSLSRLLKYDSINSIRDSSDADVAVFTNTDTIHSSYTHYQYRDSLDAFLEKAGIKTTIHTSPLILDPLIHFQLFSNNHTLKHLLPEIDNGLKLKICS